MRYNTLLCRYNEIGTKTGNRRMFEDMLVNSLRRRLVARLGELHFIFDRGRIFAHPANGDFFPEELEYVLQAEIPGIAGIASVSPAMELPADIEALQQYLDEAFEKALAKAKKRRSISTYAMRVRRTDKNFPMHSNEIEMHFAQRFLPSHPELSLDLKKSDFTIEVEIRQTGKLYVSFDRIEGPGGLPVGSGGKVLALLSGGFDSPVACYEMMRRGCSVDFISFHSEPYTPQATITKICSVVRQLNNFQKRTRLVAINLLPMQKAVRDFCKGKYRTVLYRRFMIRLADILADEFKDEALVTGDNLGQVASQTLTNMSTINQVARRVVLRPLLTFDKLGIMDIAKKIGTHDISIQQVPDSCTVFQPTDPTTHAELANVLAEEANLDIPALLLECLNTAELINPRTLNRHSFPELAKKYQESLEKMAEK